MKVLGGVLNQAVAVTQALLGIAVNTAGAVKKGLAELAKAAMDPLARRRVEKERQRFEKRQTDIDNEKREILNQAKRDGRWSASAVDRYEDLTRIRQCAVQRCTISVGAKPTRQESFQPVAIGTAVEVTKRSKLLKKRVRKGLSERAGRNVQ